MESNMSDASRHTEYRQPCPEADRWSREVIGAAIEVHRHLGPGFLTSVYEEALVVEMRLRGIPFQRNEPVGVSYKDEPVGGSLVDFIVGKALLLKIKTVEEISPLSMAEMISDLKAAGLDLGLILNFKAVTMKDGVKRVVWTKKGTQEVE